MAGRLMVSDCLGASGQPTTLAARDAMYMLLEESTWTDYNGDGDLGDGVLFTQDLVSGATTNLALAGWLEHRGRREPYVPLRIKEYEQGGTDLNGDGDGTDLVLFVFDSLRNVTVNLRLASRCSKRRPDESAGLSLGPRDRGRSATAVAGS